MVIRKIKFIPPNRKIDLKLSKSDGLVITEVKDDGPGMPKEEFPKLFKKYQKLSTKPTAGESGARGIIFSFPSIKLENSKNR